MAPVRAQNSSRCGLRGRGGLGAARPHARRGPSVGCRAEESPGAAGGASNPSRRVRTPRESTGCCQTPGAGRGCPGSRTWALSHPFPGEAAEERGEGERDGTPRLRVQGALSPQTGAPARPSILPSTTRRDPRPPPRAQSAGPESQPPRDAYLRPRSRRQHLRHLALQELEPP